VLVKAISRLETVDLENTYLTPDQVQIILNKIANCENLKLTELNVKLNNLSTVPADVLVKAISRLESVDLDFIGFTPDQVQSIFHKIANCKNIKLTKINVSYNNLSSVPVDVLVKAISRLETVDLSFTRLTSDQVQSIFRKIANCETIKLKKLNISSNNLSSVPADMLVKAISRLETVNLRNTKLTPAQIIATFTLVAENTSSSLREVRLSKYWNNVQVVPGELRERAEANRSVSYLV